MDGSRQLRLGVLVLEELVGREHRDAVPGANLVAEGAADTAGEVDRADLVDLLHARPRDRADAIDGAHHEARLAACAHVLIEQRENLGELLLGHRWINCTAVTARYQIG